MEKYHMKKVIINIFIILILLSFIGCSPAQQTMSQASDSAIASLESKVQELENALKTKEQTSPSPSTTKPTTSVEESPSPNSTTIEIPEKLSNILDLCDVQGEYSLNEFINRYDAYVETLEGLIEELDLRNMEYDTTYDTDILGVQSKMAVNVKVAEGGGFDLGLSEDKQILTLRFGMMNLEENEETYLVKWLAYANAIMRGLDLKITNQQCKDTINDVIKRKFNQKKCQYKINDFVYSFYINEFTGLPTLDVARKV